VNRVEPLIVRHALGSYPVYLQPGALGALAEVVAAHCAGRLVALVTDATTGLLYEAWESGAPSAWREGAAAHDVVPFATRLSLPPGEQHKTRGSWEMLTDALLDQGFGRDAALVGVGGGVIGDLTGFVAATYQRGVPFVLVPTTLLAMVDASVGGKTGVDTPQGKNLIGAFHPPVAVVADPATLRTLPDRELRAGMAEAVKHGLITDAPYLEWIEANATALLERDLDALTHLVRRSVEIKASVVSADEREAGPRAMLNAGHTVAHALEHASGYDMLHGEAVALGLRAECVMGELAGLLPAGTFARVAGALERLGLPARTTGLTPERVRAAMHRDKKNLAGETRFAIPVGLGAMAARDGGRWTVALPEDVIAKGLATIL
jgi:3-dehydroquinate synthase